MTAKGLLLSGDPGFWVRGGWSSRNVAPARTDPASGVPTSVAPGYVLAKWQPAKGSKDARARTTSGRCTTRRPGSRWSRCGATSRRSSRASIRRPMLSPDGGYLVAGNLAFDLERRKAYCFEESDGSKPLTLTSVTDSGTAYGATSARSAADALAGGGDADRAGPGHRARPRRCRPMSGCPRAEAAGVGVFSWTDAKDRLHLIGYPRRDG